MKRIRIQKRVPHPRREQYEELPLDPRDPDILRVKRATKRATPAVRHASYKRAA